LSLLVNRASMTGLIVYDYEARYDEATNQLLAWLDAGCLIAREQVVRGDVSHFQNCCSAWLPERTRESWFWSWHDLFDGPVDGCIRGEVVRSPD
jgi:hypothetical protein